jgi:hypothetical protein
LYLLCRYGQGHVLHFWDSLSSLEQSQLVADLGTIDLEEMQEMWTSSQSTSGLPGIQVGDSSIKQHHLVADIGTSAMEKMWTSTLYTRAL